MNEVGTPNAPYRYLQDDRLKSGLAWLSNPYCVSTSDRCRFLLSEYKDALILSDSSNGTLADKNIRPGKLPAIASTCRTRKPFEAPLQVLRKCFWRTTL